MRIAALDLGTNSFLCLIVEVKGPGQIDIIHDEMVIVRLGQELGKTGRIHNEALKRADDCLNHFSSSIKNYKVNKVQAVATAAAREASNSNEFMQICKKYQIPLVTITGEEEARMSFQGAIDPGINERVLLIDIGGGSTEYIVGKAGQIELAQSLSYGAVKLTEKFIQESTEEMWAQIETLCPSKIFAVAGTPTALVAAILGNFVAEKIDGFVLTNKSLSEWVQKLRASSVEDKRQKYGFGDRSDVIFAGTIILDELLKRLNKSEMVVSTKGIRYGLAYKMASSIS